MHIHYSCPACRETVSGDGLLLTDDRFSKADVLFLLDENRERTANGVRAHAEELGATMADFTGITPGNEVVNRS